MKKITTIVFAVISTICFAQVTVLKDVTIENNTYQIQSETGKNYKEKDIKKIRVVRLVNDTIVSQVEAFKDNNLVKDEIDSKFQILDNAFIFEKTVQNENGNPMYTLDRIYIDNKGNLFEGMQNGQSSLLRPDINTHSAEFNGGEKRLRNWIQNYFDPTDFYDYTNEPILKLFVKLTIDEMGQPKVNEINGTESLKIKEIVLATIAKMPVWIPAMENAVKVKANINIPIYLTMPE